MSQESAEKRIERLERAIGVALELIAGGRSEQARQELARVVGPPTPPGALPGLEFPRRVSDQELERAFEAAAPETDRMLDADRVAEVAMREAGEVLGDQLTPDQVGAAFVTPTMARLLERQGDAAGAARIRARLAEAAAPAGSAPGRSRQQVIATLERWLDNLRGGARA